LYILSSELVTALLAAAAGTRPFDTFSRMHYTAGLVKGLNDTNTPLCCLAAHVHAGLVCAVPTSAELVLTASHGKGHMSRHPMKECPISINLAEGPNKVVDQCLP